MIDRTSRPKKEKNRLEFKLDTLVVNYNPTTVLHIGTFAGSIQETLSSLRSQQAEGTPAHSENANASASNQTMAAYDDMVNVKVKFEFKKLVIRFNKPHLARHVVEFGLAETYMSFWLKNNWSYKLDGRIGNFTAHDMTKECKKYGEKQTSAPKEIESRIHEESELR